MTPHQTGWLGVFVVLPAALCAWALLTYAPTPTLWLIPWIPSLDINLSFRLDGLSVLFMGLICGIGFLIQLYALPYMKGKHGRFSFHLYLTLFMLAMVGLVMADNILLLFVFWELTTLTSYLLIGFNHEQEKARKNALQAMLVTGSGGLALLAGLILLGEMVGSYEISHIIDHAPLLKHHALFIPSLILILLGCFTKSAQFPFHFWLPNAMAAPTPVSAYLHSATMVKAGIYLLARLSPIYADTPLWQYALTIAGSVTAVWAALVALQQTDIKLMLAYTTNSVLGLLTLMLGIGSPYALTAVVTLILAHAFYKAALFMVVGIIDKATGTRDYAHLANLWRVLPLSFGAAGLAALSSAGIPPFMGFVSKEYMYKASLPFMDGFLIAAVLANALIVTIALVVMIKPFLGKPDAHTHTPKPVEGYTLLWLPALFLGLLSIMLPLAGLGWLDSVLVTPASIAMNPQAYPSDVTLWHGWTAALALSGVTLILGCVIYIFYIPLKASLLRFCRSLPVASNVYNQALDGLLWFADKQTRFLQQGRLSIYSLMFFSVMAGLLLISLPWQTPPTINGLGVLTFYEISFAVMLIVAALAATLATSRLLAIAALGVVGFIIALIFMLYSAADVAMTQILVETLVVVFLVVIIRHLPMLESVPCYSRRRRLTHAGVATIIGGSIGMALLHITSLPLDTSLADYFGQSSYPLAHGRNIVNVILVDFRAIDTFGEIVVVVTAGLAALSLMYRGKERGKP